MRPVSHRRIPRRVEEVGLRFCVPGVTTPVALVGQSLMWLPDSSPARGTRRAQAGRGYARRFNML